MNISKKFFSLCLLISFVFARNALGEAHVSFAGCDTNDPAYIAFAAAHPDVKIDINSNTYYNTQQVLNSFLTGELPYDVFSLTTQTFQIRLLMEKGYLMPLATNGVIQSFVANMYAPFREQLSYNGILYGIPYACGVYYYAYDPDAWAEAGLTETNVPTSFTDYLNFLDQWVLRIQDEPEDAISVCNSFDSEQYGPHSYILYLVQLLVENYILQSNYNGVPIRFNTPTFMNLLNRCQKIGQALYTYEPEQKGMYALFEERTTLQQLRYLVPLRLTEDQPIIVKASIYASFINIRSQESALSEDFLIQRLQHISPQDNVYFYPDAEPVKDENQQHLAEALSEVIADLETELTKENLTEDERIAVMSRLEEKKQQYANATDPAKLYNISPDDIAVYQEYGDRLFFQPPSIFDPSTDDGQNVLRLEKRFALGQLTSEQFVQELDRLSRMLEMENE